MGAAGLYLAIAFAGVVLVHLGGVTLGDELRERGYRQPYLRAFTALLLLLAVALTFLDFALPEPVQAAPLRPHDLLR